MQLPLCDTSVPMGDASDTNNTCDETKYYTSIADIESSSGNKNEWLRYYAEWTNFSNTIVGDDGDSVCSLIRLLWAGTLSYIKGTSSDTIYGTNAALKVPTGTATDHYYVANVKGGKPWGTIGDTIKDEKINDPSRLNIQMVEDGGYHPRNGFSQAGCNSVATAIKGQGYTASATALGYCRSQFFNRITLYTIIGLLIFWVLTLPMFILIRWYINRGVSTKYLAAANAQGNRRKRTRVAQNNTTTNQPNQDQPNQNQTNQNQTNQPNEEASLGSFDNGSPNAKNAKNVKRAENEEDGQQGVELGEATTKMKRTAQNMKLNEEDVQAAQEKQVQAQKEQAPAPSPEPEPEAQPSQPQTHNDKGQSLDPLMGVPTTEYNNNISAGRRKRGRKGKYR